MLLSICTKNALRIEDAFNTVKRLLGLSYLWTGSINGIKLQIWATCGATPRRRQAQDKELARISLEMIPMWSLLFSWCFK